MIYYFDQLLVDFNACFGVNCTSLERWRLMGGPDIPGQMVHYVAASIIIAWLVVAYYLSWTGWEMFVVATVIFGSLALGYAYALITFNKWDQGRRTGPGVARKYHIPLADAVERTEQALRDGSVPFTVTSVILTDRPDRPRATIFEMARSRVLLSLWKDMDDPYFTVAHLGPYSIMKENAVRSLKTMLDRHLGAP